MLKIIGLAPFVSIFLFNVSIDSFAIAYQGENEQTEKKQDVNPVKTKITKAINIIFVAMNEVDRNAKDGAVKSLAECCQKIQKQFDSITDKNIPDDIADEFKTAKNNFASFYKLFLEVADKDFEQVSGHVGDSAAEYGQSFEKLMEKAKECGYEIGDGINDTPDDPKTATTIARIKTLKLACQHFKLDTGAYPGVLANLVKDSGNLKGKWRGPYLSGENVLKDAWETKYNLALNMEANEIEIISAGPDKKFGTDDDLNSSSIN